jgi:hypothetical protein
MQDLDAPLVHIILIDADGVNPQVSTRRGVPEMLQRHEQVMRNRQGLTTALNGKLGLRIAPCV